MSSPRSALRSPSTSAAPRVMRDPSAATAGTVVMTSPRPAIRIDYTHTNGDGEEGRADLADSDFTLRGGRGSAQDPGPTSPCSGGGGEKRADREDPTATSRLRRL